MVVHQYIGMQGTFGVLQGLMQPSETAVSILGIEKAWQPVVAALDDVLRDAGKVEAGATCHAVMVR